VLGRKLHAVAIDAASKGQHLLDDAGPRSALLSITLSSDSVSGSA
jgi:hypothetical protein